MLKILSFLLTLLIFLSGCAGPATFDRGSTPPLARKAIALMPFENFSDKKEGVEKGLPCARRWFKNAGFEIVPDEVVKKFLLQHEIRSAGRFSDKTIRAMDRELGVAYILLGNVNLCSDDPLLSISTRLVSVPDGNVVWGGHASRSGEEFKTALGLGKITTLAELAPVVIDELFFPLKRFAPPDSAEREKWHFRVAVMPFENLSTHKDAGIIITYLFLSGIAQKTGWATVEYGKVWNTLVSENYPYRGELDYDTLQALGKKLGVQGIMLGTVEKYSEGVGTRGQVIPEVAISLRLLYVPNKTIIWADRLGATGEDDILVLDWGRIRTADKVAEKVIKKLVQRLPYIEDNKICFEP
ncbi:MAG: hypothetical protein D4R73_10245 [Deltaproteobacteria bacterium]|nr:MAG: hypothetical protein D4R73_10245 [Deltaproteobacteria bacterium]